MAGEKTLNAEAVVKFMSEYEVAAEKVAAMKRALVNAETEQSEIVKKVAAEMQGVKKLKWKGRELTIVVRENAKLGRTTYFLRGKSEDADVLDLG
jgi:hypothetical protein